METLIARNLERVISAGAGTILALTAGLAVYLLYRYYMAKLATWREGRKQEPESEKGKGDCAEAKLAIAEAVQNCQEKHENRIKEMEIRIIDTVKEETRAVHQQEPESEKGKGDCAEAKLVISEAVQNCQEKHESRIKEMEERIIDTVKEETREVHRRVDRLHEILAQGVKV